MSFATPPATTCVLALLIHVDSPGNPESVPILPIPSAHTKRIYEGKDDEECEHPRHDRVRKRRHVQACRVLLGLIRFLVQASCAPHEDGGKVVLVDDRRGNQELLGLRIFVSLIKM